MKHGFTLVELSIVLVVVGLIIGGIFAGKNLMRSGEIKSVSSDFNRYQSAILAFKDKYGALPGDMPNATTYWGSLDGNGRTNTCYGSTANGLPTCNGDGDDMVQWYGGGYGYTEINHVWQHLANAGLIQGRYTAEGNVTCDPGVRCPASKITNAGFTFLYIAYGGGFGETFSSAFNSNILTFGLLNGITRSAAITPEEAWSIDTKLDDGKPDSGEMQSGSFNPTCYTGTYPNLSYALNVKTVACALYLRTL